jgi:hypothetical protein
MPSKGKKEPLIIKINRITQSGFSPNSSVDLSITFYTKSNNSYIEVLQTASFTYIRWNSFFGNEERKRGEVILNAFKKCFLDLQNRFESGSLRSRVVSMDELSIIAPFDEKTFPILASKAKPEKGLFHNFSDFIDLNADTSIYFYLEKNNSKKSDLKYVFAQPISPDIWGGFDGENYFIRLADRFFKLEMLEGKLFMILNHADTRSLEVDHGISIGRAGYTLSVMERTKKSLVYKARIDWYSGRFIRENLEMILMNSSNKKWGDLTFYKDGEKLGILKKDEFFRIEYIPPAGMALLEMRSNGFSEKIWFNPLIESMIRVRQNQNGIRIIDRILISENDKLLYLESKKEVQIEKFP